MTTLRAKKPLPRDTFDRATDAEYAPLSTTAVLALVFALVGTLGFVVFPALALSAVGLVLGLVAARKIRRSEGALVGRRAADAAVALSLLVLAAGGAHRGWKHFTEERLYGDLQARALEAADDLLAGRYERVFERFPQDWQKHQPGGADGLRRRLAPLFENAGDLVGRDLRFLQVLTTEDGQAVAPAEVRVELAQRILNLTLWFKQASDGRWDLVGVGGEETLESLGKHPTDRGPVTVPGPYVKQHDDHQH